MIETILGFTVDQWRIVAAWYRLKALDTAEPLALTALTTKEAQ